MARAAYLHYGSSQALKDEINASYKQKDLANLYKAIGNTQTMKNMHGHLEVIHDLRCDVGEEAHPGELATDAHLTSAKTSFEKVAKTSFGLLKSANGV